MSASLQFAISTVGNSAWLIGAGYMIVNEAGHMIVNELALTPAGCGVNRIAAGLADLIHRVRSPTRARGDPRLAETRGTPRTVYGILCERHTADAKKESTVTPRP
jgi:hypothetical protein